MWGYVSERTRVQLPARWTARIALETLESTTSHQPLLSTELPAMATGSCPASAASKKRAPLLFCCSIPSFNSHSAQRANPNPNPNTMAEICCETETSAVSEVSPRSARRRRMQLRRFRFVSGEDAVEMPDELRRKKQKTDLAAAAAALPALPRALSVKAGSPLQPRAKPAASDGRRRYGVTSVCGRRRDMEDAVAVHPRLFRRCRDQAAESFDFFGVYDGHGCSHVATSCKERMHELVAEEVGRLAPEAAGWEAAMRASFARMDEESRRGRVGATCRCEMQLPKCDHVGSTAVVAVVSPQTIVVANCGDSRAVLCRNGAPVPLSVDHKPDRPDELERIEAAGGRVIFWQGARVLGVLAMSRAIGDGYLKPFVISDPEVTVTERTGEEECLILASDGLWDVVSNEMACGIVKMCLRGSGPAGDGDVEASDRACLDAAMLLTKLALARQSADNVSVVVVDLRRPNIGAL